MAIDPQVPEIDIAGLVTARLSGTPLIDVRQLEEFVEAHAPGAKHIALATLPDHVDQVPESGPVYVICAAGGRSFRACEFLRAQGIDAINVAGGTKAWLDAGQPFETGAS